VRAERHDHKARHFRVPVAARRSLDAPARERQFRQSSMGHRGAFPGSKIEITGSDGYFQLEMLQHGLLRPLKAANFPTAHCAICC